MEQSKIADVTNDPGVYNGPCPYCGAPRDLWPNDGNGGYKQDGLVFCTAGCREGTGCTSDHFGKGHPWKTEAPTDDDIRFDEASAAFLNEHRKENKTIEPEEYGDPTVEKRAGPTQGVD